VSDDRLDAEVLGRLLVALQTLDILPDVKPMAAFLHSALGGVPGITSAFVCLDRKILPCDQPQTSSGRPLRVVETYAAVSW
jgi:hypothetical protein